MCPVSISAAVPDGAASCPALGPAGRGPPCQGPWHLRGTVPSLPYQGPRHLWHGAAALPLCQLCGCSDPSWGVEHAGPVVPILVPPRVAATWLSPPPCQGPRHLQEGAHVPAWGVFAPSRPPGALSGRSAPEASRGVGVRAPSQPGQSCGRWSPRQMRPVARMRLHLCVRPQLPGQRPRIQLLQNWFPFGSVAACLLPPLEA